MKWITHQTGAIFCALALSLPLPAIAGASAGSIVPDVLDMRASKLASTRRGQRKIFNAIHRGASHWFGWWLALFLALPILALPPLLADAAYGFALGALSHIGLDLLTPRGVPVLPLKRGLRAVAPICSTGRASEHIFLGLMICAGAFLFRNSWLPLLGDLARYF